MELNATILELQTRMQEECTALIYNTTPIVYFLLGEGRDKIIKVTHNVIRHHTLDHGREIESVAGVYAPYFFERIHLLDLYSTYHIMRKRTTADDAKLYIVNHINKRITASENFNELVMSYVQLVSTINVLQASNSYDKKWYSVFSCFYTGLLQSSPNPDTEKMRKDELYVEVVGCYKKFIEFFNSL